MADIKLNGPSMEQRIANRLRSSGEGSGADITTRHGDGPTRTVTHIHHSARHVAPSKAGAMDRDRGDKQ